MQYFDNHEIKPCWECGSQRIYANRQGYFITVSKKSEKESVFDRKISVDRALVCTNCGATTLVAKNPDNLAD